MSDDDSDGVDFAALLKPLQKSIKKQGKQLEKLEAALKESKESHELKESKEGAREARLDEVVSGLKSLRERLDTCPWREVRPAACECLLTLRHSS